MCAVEKARKRRADNPERVREIGRASQKKRRAADPAKHVAEVRAWQVANPDKRRATMSRWKKANPDKVRADRSARRGKVRGQMCGCCTAADFAIVYEAARLTGTEVDHAIPIALGGLHCTMNMQLLTPEAHLEKSRKDISVIATMRHAERRANREPAA